MTKTHVPIVRVIQIGPVEKVGREFSVLVKDIMADGSTNEYYYRRQLRRKVVAYIATLPAAPDLPTWAIIANGVVVGRQTEISLNPNHISDRTQQWLDAVEKYNAWENDQKGDE